MEELVLEVVLTVDEEEVVLEEVVELDVDAFVVDEDVDLEEVVLVDEVNFEVDDDVVGLVVNDPLVVVMTKGEVAAFFVVDDEVVDEVVSL